MNLVNHTLNVICLTLLLLSIAIFWCNKNLEIKIDELAIGAQILNRELEKIHQTCKDKVVSSFPRIPATHMVKHNEKELLNLNVEINVTFVLLLLLKEKDSLRCHHRQIKSIQNTFPAGKIIRSVVSQGSSIVEPIPGVKTIGMYSSKAKALNMAVKEVDTPYFVLLQQNFIIEPQHADTGIQWLHHALVFTPGVDIIGGSMLLNNNELVVSCYSLNLCNWTIIQKYEYQRSFGEIMICDEVSHSFMAQTRIFNKFDGELFDENLEAGNYMFIDFFLQAKKLHLNVANRPEVLFVQMDACSVPENSMQHIMALAKKYKIMRFKNPENEMYSICDRRLGNICSTENLVKNFKFPRWYENGLFAFPFVIEQAISTLESLANKLRKSGIYFVLHGETLFGAIMTQSILPWGRLNFIHLKAYAKEKEVLGFAVANDYKHEINGHTISIFVQLPGFSLPMKVIILLASDKSAKFTNVRVNGKLYHAPLDPIAELKSFYGDNYLLGEDGKAKDFSCKLDGHHACLPSMPSRGSSTYKENYCEI